MRGSEFCKTNPTNKRAFARKAAIERPGACINAIAQGPGARRGEMRSSGLYKTNHKTKRAFARKAAIERLGACINAIARGAGGKKGGNEKLWAL